MPRLVRRPAARPSTPPSAAAPSPYERSPRSPSRWTRRRAVVPEPLSRTDPVNVAEGRSTILSRGPTPQGRMTASLPVRSLPPYNSSRARPERERGGARPAIHALPTPVPLCHLPAAPPLCPPSYPSGPGCRPLFPLTKTLFQQGPQGVPVERAHLPQPSPLRGK